MHRLITILLGTVILITTSNVYAQNKNKGHADINALFDDLPIEDPRENSFLKEDEDPADKISRNIFATASVNKTRCYAGEPLLLTYHLYSRLLSESTIGQRPSLFGFTVTEIGTNNETPQQKTFKGLSYRMFTVQQLQLVPFKEGKLTIDPVSINNSVTYEKTGRKKYKYAGAVSSNELNITVEPLPGQGRPEDFSGLVGAYQLVAYARSPSVRAGENNVLHVEITGSGNFTNTGVPLIKWPEGFETFPGNSETKRVGDSFPLKNTMTFAVPFIVKNEGNYTVPAARISYFDPSSGKYQTAYSMPVELKITPAAPAQVTAPSQVTAGSNYRYYIAGILALVLLSVTGLVIYRKKNQRALAIVKAEPVIMNEQIPVTEGSGTDFSNETEALEQIGDDKEFIAALKQLLVKYMQQQAEARVSSDRSMDRTDDGNDDADKDIQQLCDECDLLLYAPVAIEMHMRKSMLDRFKAIADRWTKDNL